MGDWLSWLERCVHIAEVTGSNPVSPTSFECPIMCRAFFIIMRDKLGQIGTKSAHSFAHWFL